MRKLHKRHQVHYSGPAPLQDVLKDVRKFVKGTEQFVISVDLQMYQEDDYLGWTATVVLDGDSDWVGDTPQ